MSAAALPMVCGGLADADRSTLPMAPKINKDDLPRGELLHCLRVSMRPGPN